MAMTAKNMPYKSGFGPFASDVYRAPLSYPFRDGLSGPDAAARFYQDRMRWSDYNRILLAIRRRWRGMVAASWSVLGLPGIARWAGDYARFGGETALASLARIGGPRAERLLVALADTASPSAGLHLRARYASWRAMGWL